MREQLIQYVNLLFAGAPNSEEVRAEILQNTLDRYDDLIAQGKSPEAAYRLAISGIGDINEILGAAPNQSAPVYPHPAEQHTEDGQDDPYNRKMRAIAIAMYILCPIPLFILSEFGLDTLGLCLTLLIVACATYLMTLIKKKSAKVTPGAADMSTPRKELKKSVSNLVWAIGLAVYFVLSFATRAWYITWIIFPIIGCVQGLAKAIIDLKEALRNEN